VPQETKVVVIGAGIGGLTAALALAARGLDVTVLERTPAPGGKIREIMVDGRAIDSGPTVLTMRWVFDQLFDDCGEVLGHHVGLRCADILARHAWSADERLDLFADIERSADAIGTFSSAGEAKRFRAYCARAKAIYATLAGPFIMASQPTPLSLTVTAGLRGLGDLWRISPFVTLWHALGTYFHDKRLRQLFGRYATYCGSSPFDAPATLMLVSHVEQEGVWLVEGGMHRLATALEQCAKAKGAVFRYGCDVHEISISSGRASAVTLATGERLAADVVLTNADVAAVAAGCFGEAAKAAVPAMKRASRSLSAVTFSMVAKTTGFPLVRHNVFFSNDYEAEFGAIFHRGAIPDAPTVYVCAQDRGAQDRGAANEPIPETQESERLFCLVNAPPLGDARSFSMEEIERCQDRVFSLLQRSGLTVGPTALVTTTPNEFERLYPATGGALYGQASHGWTASFSRPTARTKIPGLYLAGGSTHPGPGVPMAALSGRLAAASILEDLTSAKRSRRAAMSGGMSMA
jgi:1-hydroxycarotenoid 3,4-desaturase